MCPASPHTTRSRAGARKPHALERSSPGPASSLCRGRHTWRSSSARESSRSGRPSLGRIATRAGGVFVGDGLYAGDGARSSSDSGDSRTAAAWRPLPGCDGRWVARKPELERCAPKRSHAPRCRLRASMARACAVPPRRRTRSSCRLTAAAACCPSSSPTAASCTRATPSRGSAAVARARPAAGRWSARCAGAAGGRGAEPIARAGSCDRRAACSRAGRRARGAHARGARGVRRAPARSARAALGREVGARSRARRRPTPRSLVSYLSRLADRGPTVRRNTCTKDPTAFVGCSIHATANAAGCGGDREAPPPPPPPPRSRGT